MTAQIDHLVVGAASLDEGVDWCKRTLGITPGPGGEHPLMGTHNRLFSIASAQYPKAYFEIIAIHSGAACQRFQGAKRWFDLDNPALQHQLKQNGPQLIHFVASTRRASAAVLALSQLGIDRGELLQASRMTEQGKLAWSISVRADGQRLMNGALPTLIEWGDVHPTDTLEASGVTLQSLHAEDIPSDALRTAYEAMGLTHVNVQEGRPNLVAVLQTPRGLVTLESGGH